MKYVYFVRHGQTLKNTQHIHQGPEEPLTAVGTQQAHAVAAVLQEKGIDALISSPFTRAVETASVIGEALSLPIIQSAAVQEFRRPNVLYGRSHYSLASAWYVWQLFWHRHDPRWNNDGAENMYDIRNRILDTRRLVRETDGERIAIISHAIFIDMFTQAVCADRSLTFREFAQALLGAKKLPNTGIVAFTVDEAAPPETCNWWLEDAETSPQYLRYR